MIIYYHSSNNFDQVRSIFTNEIPMTLLLNDESSMKRVKFVD